jgi:hypothetical protein
MMARRSLLAYPSVWMSSLAAQRNDLLSKQQLLTWWTVRAGSFSLKISASLLKKKILKKNLKK